ncbi:hypothetical protein SDC9_90569 [bioreactor metagenome]|uniref:Uncharacterized protein n=1 Tax=bioreactor metagenome TaxID=1076179 RepID=A0A644ZSR2_9ZZZZ
MVHEPHEIERCAIPGRRRKVPGALIAPGVVQRVLRHRQQLDGVVPHVLHIGRKVFGNGAVIVKSLVRSSPGAKVNLVDVQGRGINRVVSLFLPEFRIGPWKALDVYELAGRCGAGLRVESVGVRLVAHGAVRSGHGIFIGGIPGQVRQKSGPGLPLPLQRRGGDIPLVEISHHAHRGGVGRPDPE